jgi:ABC-2 type transport system ATP-binding protein
MSEIQKSALPMAVVEHADKVMTLRHTRSIKEYVVWSLKGRKQDYADTFKALDDISLTINRGEQVGLVGLNGSGKSTLLKLLSGVMQPDAGSVEVRGTVAGLIEVGAGFHPDLTGKENIFLNGAILGMSKEQIEERYDDIVNFSEIHKFLDTEVKFYSSGMFLRLAFSVAVYALPDLFLVDEILAVGDVPFQKKCLDRIEELREQGQTLIVVSHDMKMIRKVCKRGIVLEQGKMVFDGTIKEAIARIA